MQVSLTNSDQRFTSNFKQVNLLSTILTYYAVLILSKSYSEPNTKYTFIENNLKHINETVYSIISAIGQPNPHSSQIQ